MNSLKAAAWMAVSGSDLDDEDKIIAACLTFDYLRKLTDAYNADLSGSYTSASKTASSIIDELESYRTTYASYHTVRKAASKLTGKSFPTIPDGSIDSICALYTKKTKAVSFSPYSFSPAMYLIDDCDTPRREYLSHVHYDIIAPIFYYYSKSNGIARSSFHIYSADGSENSPGKLVSFYIDGVNSVLVKNDITSGRVGVISDYYDWVRLDDSRVLIQTE